MSEQDGLQQQVERWRKELAEPYEVGELDDHDEDALPRVRVPEGEEWQAPAPLEQRLYELLQGGGDASDAVLGYLEVMAEDFLYVPFPREDTSPDPAERAFPVDEPPKFGRVVKVYTRGLLPRPHPYVAYETYTLWELAEALPEDVEGIAVNVRTPCYAMLAADKEERHIWRVLHNRHWDQSALAQRLVTRRTGAPPVGPLLHGLGLGGHMCFVNGEAWNNPDYHGLGMSTERERLAEWWEVTDRASWQEIQRRLLDGDVLAWYWEFVLAVRSELADRHTRGRRQRVDPAVWRECVELTLRDRARHAAPAELGEQWEEFVAHVVGVVGKILRYEARFRADGLLAPDTAVRSVAAWDLGRASMMARWGYGARYATRAEMEEAVIEAGRTAQAAHTSWHDFSAGYALGRCLHFDEEEFGSWYGEMLEAHRALDADPAGPWHSVPFALRRTADRG